MDSIRLRNFRCFREEQTARLAPLTLLVGENSTGKTSFMAMIRALWDVLDRKRSPDFKESPYDLGSFAEIVHHRGGRGGLADSFEAGFAVRPEAASGKKRRAGSNGQPYRFDVTFEKSGSAPTLSRVRLAREDAWLEIVREGPSLEVSFETPRGAWRVSDGRLNKWSEMWGKELDWQFCIHWIFQRGVRSPENKIEFIRMEASGQPTEDDFELAGQFEIGSYSYSSFGWGQPFASAPVRSKPRRTYDPSRLTPDPEGDYIPMYLANLSHQDQDRWKQLKKVVEEFGREAGLFDEIHIRHLGKRDSEPFQVQVRKSGRSLKGPRRNLIDVGYGVSQVLPVITELLRKDAPRMFLLQQPEVHLHPSAQAALGSLFCQVAAPARQLIVETHSDHLLDRVRMDVRDREGRLKPDDVSILFFERDDLDVHIHPLRLDEEGNVLDAPDSYRRFFMEETRRSLWKR